MSKKCSVFGCTTGYDTDPYDGTVYSLPDKERFPEERNLWIKALPNILPENFFLDLMSVYDLHWPKNFQKTKAKRWWVPAEPPPIFPGVPRSCTQQTSAKVSGKVESRWVTADERRSRQATMEGEQQAKLNNICDWSSLKQHLELHFSETESGITLFSLLNNHPPVVQFSIVISSSYIVNCFVRTQGYPLII